MRRPVFTAMVALVLIVLGGVSLARLRIDLLPSIELPVASIRTEYEGASPAVMERLVTQIVEEIAATVPGVEEMTSVSEEGSSRVNVRFSWGTNLDSAAMDLRATLEGEINELPDDVVRPRIHKFSIDTFPVVLIGISSDMDPVALTELIEDRIRHRFTQIPGVAQVDEWGGFPREVRIEILPERLFALGLTLSEILDRVKDANLDLPAGQIEEGRFEVTLRAPSQFENLEEIRNTVLTVQNGAAVTLGGVAEVKDTYEQLTRITRVNGRRGIRIAIRKQADANTVEVSRRILQEIDNLNRKYPRIKIVPVINQGNFIERSIKNVALSVLYGGGLAILVLLYFLRSIRSTLIISVSIPISIIATFALIYFGGLTINLMTLGGLALGVGMMVDSSIVVIENIFSKRNRQGGLPGEVASDGAAEVGPAIFASTITTLVIFLPVVFVEGVTGLLFREMAYVIAFSLICSLVVSLSVVPMLASRFLKRPAAAETSRSWKTRLKERSQASFERLCDRYATVLRWSIRHRAQVIVVSLLLLAAALISASRIGTEFLPPSDEGEVRVTGEMEVGTRLDLLDKQTRIMESIVYPAVPETVSSVVDVRGERSEIRLSLTPSSKRSRSNEQIAADLRKLLDGRIPGMKIRTRAPQGQFLLDRLLGGDEGVTIEIRGYDFQVFAALAEKVEKAVAHIRGVTDVDKSLKLNSPQQEIIIDRAKAADLGLSPRDASEAIETAVAGSKAGNFRSEGNSHRILVQLKDAKKRSLDEVLNLTLKTRTGQVVPLRNFVTTVAGRAPTVITRKNQQRQITVTANVEGRDLGSTARDIDAALADIAVPEGCEINVAGKFEEQQKSFRELTLALFLSLLLVYMVLAAQYESFRDPLVVMLSTPFSAVGVIGILLATHTTLNLQSGIGCVMLGGIVVNNAILLVDQAGRLVASGQTVLDAAVEAGRRRIRPILMTTLTTILGMLPLALGIGEGADAEAPLARAVVGGLAGSTLITLILIPVVYTLTHGRTKQEEIA